MAHHANLRCPASYDRVRNEPELLDRDMRPSDISDALKRLHFTRGTPTTIKLDKDVRDFLVRCVARHGQRPR